MDIYNSGFKFSTFSSKRRPLFLKTKQNKTKQNTSSLAFPEPPGVYEGEKSGFLLSTYINDYALHCIQHTGTRVGEKTVTPRHLLYSGTLIGTIVLHRKGWPQSRFYGDSPNYNPSESTAYST